jgi:hypothetical protein
MSTIRSDLFPIKNYEDFEGCSIANLISVVEKSEEEVYFQVLIEKQASSASYHFKRSWRKKLFKFFDSLNPRSWLHPQLRQIRKSAYEKVENKLKADVFKSSIQFAAKND